MLETKQLKVIENLKPTLIELKKQGVNLNQIAKALNEYSPMTNEMESIIKNCNSLYKKLIDMEMN